MKKTFLQLVTNVVGIGIFNMDGKRGGTLLTIYNLTFAFFLIVNGVFGCYNEKIKSVTFSGLSVLNVYSTFGGMTLAALFIIVSSTHWQQSYYNFHKEIENISHYVVTRFKKSVTLYQLDHYGTIFVLLTFPVLAMSELVLKDQYVSIPFCICTHTSGVIIIVYMTHVTTLIKACTKAFGVLQEYLESYTVPHMNTMERICVSLENTIPKKLITNDETSGNLHQVLMIHYRVCALVKEINRVSGIGFCCVIVCGSCSTLGMCYNIMMYFITGLQRSNTQWCILYSQAYWTIVYFGIIVEISTVVQTVANGGINFGIILHKLRNLYPGLGDEWVNAHSMQLLNGKMHLTAAGFFVLDNNFLSQVIATMASILAIVIQYDENYLFKKPKVKLAQVHGHNGSTVEVQ